MTTSGDMERARLVRAAVNRAPGVGEVMPNGATVVAQRKLGDDGEWAVRYAVLGVLPKEQKQGRDRYVVWSRSVGVSETATGEWKDEDYCFWGYPTCDFRHAVEQYERRKA